MQYNSELDLLLVNYMLSECTEQERLAVEAWIRESRANQEYYQQLQAVWNLTKTSSPPASAKNAAWTKVEKKIRGQHELSRRNIWWVAAASFFCVVCLAALTLRFSSKKASLHQSDEYLTDYTGTSFLPDGSIVTLDDHSTIFYPAVFHEGNRKARLNGEGFFNIKHIKGSPFTIEVAGMQVKVLGTSFYIKSSSAQTDITVYTGQVSVFHAQDSLLLHAGESVSVHRNDTLPLSELLIQNQVNRLTQVLRVHGEFIATERKRQNGDDKRRNGQDDKDQLANQGVSTGTWDSIMQSIVKIASDTPRQNRNLPDSIVRKMVAAFKTNASELFQPWPKSSELELQQRKDIVKAILDDLVVQKVANRVNNIRMFILSDTELIVNDEIQADNLHQKLKFKYIPRENYGIYYGNIKMQSSEGFHFPRQSF